jgi:hypothetical protein
LKSQQPLADGGVRVGIKLAALQIAEELVQGIVSTLFVLIRGMTRLGALAQSVIDVSIRGAGRLRGWVRLIILRSAMGVALTRDGVQGGLKVVGGRGRITLGGTAAKHHVRIPSTRLGRSDQDGVIGVGLDMFLEVLGTLEGLAAEITLVRFERDMHSNVRGDVIPLDGGGATAAPLARQVEVVGALATDMAFADVFIEGFWGWALFGASLPETRQFLGRARGVAVVDGGTGDGGGGGSGGGRHRGRRGS